MTPRRRPKLLAGGNPQIAKGDGAAPIEAWLAALPPWKQAIGRRIDELVTAALPEVHKAVRWNSPFYGVEGGGWFAAMHVFTRFVKVTFFKGAQLKPPPPGRTEKSGAGRWIDLHEGESIDAKQLTAWIRQAAKLPGWGSVDARSRPPSR